MEWFEALILGIIQGLTEFLPVSSSGHLIIGKEILGVESAENVIFETVVHGATVLATITVLWREIMHLFSRLFKFQWNEETQYICKILVSMIPVFVVGMFFKDQVEALFGEGLLLVGIMLLVTATLLAITKFVKFKAQKNVGFGSAFVIGIAQAFAVLPGLSRSGSTIATGLLMGVKKEEVAQFSFLMVIIPILGECFLDLVGGNMSAASSGISPAALVCGFIAAYVSGLFACKWMISLVKRANLIWFAVYCAIAGTVSIVFALM
ncbi:MAG: undecaprenyl-diphosphate phosphatase [Bacteroidales bacterium]|nr:undecaprenyl-diphosphate phosphatase [Bacteroidales bacterium]